MENKIESLKEIRRQTRKLDPRDEKFNQEFDKLSKQALDHLEGINDKQEKNWIEKGRDIVNSPKSDSTNGEQEKDMALSYLKEAVNAVILREDPFRE